MKAYIEPPRKIPLILRIGIWYSEKKLKREVLAGKILAWYPKAAIGAGVLESLVAHDEGRMTPRLLKLIRMQVSFRASCPFCIDMNSSEYSGYDIKDSEIEALQGIRDIDAVESFTRIEKIALLYARALTETPIQVEKELLDKILKEFNEKEMVIIVSTIAQVNYWTRFIQGVGIPPAGFSESCSILKISDYTTLKNRGSS